MNFDMDFFFLIILAALKCNGKFPKRAKSLNAKVLRPRDGLIRNKKRGKKGL